MSGAHYHFSPNRIFSDYISGVLPELGEHDVGQITFADHARNCVPEAKYIEDANDQIEYVLSRGIALNTVQE